MVSPTGGIPGSPSSGLPVSSGSSGNVTPIPLDNIQPSLSQSSLRAPGQGAPILPEGEIGFLEFAALIAEVVQALKEALVEAQEKDFTLNENFRSQSISWADSILDLREEILAETRVHVNQVDQIEQDVADAYSDLTVAINAFNSTFAPYNNLRNNVNSALNTYNSLQGLTAAQYASAIANLGGETTARNNINNPINAWNNLASILNSQATSVINNLNQAKANWESTVANANVEIDQINAKRERRGLPDISRYPEPVPTTTITLPNPAFKPIVGIVSSPLGPGNSIRPLLPYPTTVGSASAVSPLAGLAIKPSVEETQALIAPLIQALFIVLDIFATIFELLGIQIEDEVLDQLLFNGGRNIVLPDAYIQRVPEEFISIKGGGSGLGQVGMLSHGVEDLLGNDLLKTVLKDNDIPLSPRFITSLQIAALGLLSQSSLVSSSAAAQLFGNKLGFIAADSPGFAATIAVAMADTFISTVASGGTRALVNNSLQNQIFEARLSGGTTGKLTNLSAGEVANLERQLTAGFNVSILAIALGLLEKNLGFPNLSVQVLANVSGLSTIDALTAQVGGSQFQKVLDTPLSLLFIKNTLAETIAFRRGGSSPAQINAILDGALSSLGGKFESINVLQGAIRREAVLQGLSPDNASLLAYEASMLIRGEVGVPGLNEAIRTDIDSEAVARDVLDTIFEVNEAVTDSTQKEAIMERIRQDRIAVENIIRDELKAATRSGKFEINRELRNSVVQSLRSGGSRLDEAQYLANQVINLLAGDNVAPVTGINGSRLEAIRAGAISALAGDFGSKAAALVDDGIQKALAKGPISSEAEFLALVRSELALSGGEAAFDQAIAGASPLKTLSLEELHGELSGHLTGVLTPDLGTEKAEIIKDKILAVITGTPSTRDVDNAERRDPKSLIHQIGDQIDTITDKDELENLKKSLRKLIAILQAMMTPNAELGFIMQSMQDKPSTVISSLAAGQGAVKSGDILGTGPA